LPELKTQRGLEKAILASPCISASSLLASKVKADFT